MQVVKTTLAHVEELAVTMREEDKAEVWAAAHLTPFEALHEAYQASLHTGEECLTVLDAQGHVVAIGGVTKTQTEGWGGAWLLASNLVESSVGNSRWFYKFCKAITEAYWAKGYVGLTNWVDRRNTLHIRWLESIGARFDKAMRRGVENLEFVQFFICKEDNRV